MGEAWNGVGSWQLGCKSGCRRGRAGRRIKNVKEGRKKCRGCRKVGKCRKCRKAEVIGERLTGEEDGLWGSGWRAPLSFPKAGKCTILCE